MYPLYILLILYHKETSDRWKVRVRFTRYVQFMIWWLPWCGDSERDRGFYCVPDCRSVRGHSPSFSSCLILWEIGGEKYWGDSGASWVAFLLLLRIRNYKLAFFTQSWEEIPVGISEIETITRRTNFLGRNKIWKYFDNFIIVNLWWVRRSVLVNYRTTLPHIKMFQRK